MRWYVIVFEDQSDYHMMPGGIQIVQASSAKEAEGKAESLAPPWHMILHTIDCGSFEPKEIISE